MKYFSSCLWLVAFSGFLISCDNETETRNSETVLIDSTEERVPVPAEDYSDAFRALMKTTDQGVFRRVSLGMEYSEVKKLEDTTKVEEQASDHIDYMVNLPELETAEVRYIFDANQKLTRIEVNVYPKSKNSQDSLYTELSEYFSSRHGKGLDSGESAQKWENKKQDVFISMEKRDTQKVHDISIVITSLIRQSALILKEALPENQ
jgi:hypothetical protein